MEIFGLIMLLTIAVVLQHLANWLIRLFSSDEVNDNDGLLLGLGILSFIISIVLFAKAIDYINKNQPF